MRFRTHAILPALLLAASIALAAPPTITAPERVFGEAGDWVFFTVVTDGKGIETVPLDPGLTPFPAGKLKDPNEMGYRATKPGSYRVLIYTGGADGPSKPKIVTVVFGGAPTPPDVPVPPVVDPLQTTVQAAYAADTTATKAADVKALAAVYNVTAGALKDIKTSGELFAVIRGATNTRISDRLKPIRSVFGGELEKILPTDPNATLTEANRAEVAKQLNRFAAVLGGVQ